jgi:hypothetical protein
MHVWGATQPRMPQVHRLFCQFVVNGVVMLPDRRRKQDTSQASASGSQVAASVKCVSWSQLRRHLQLEMGLRYPGSGEGSAQALEAGEDQSEEAGAEGAATSRLRALLSQHPRAAHELSAFQADNNSEDPPDSHVTLARCLASLRKQMRGDLWPLVSKEPGSLPVLVAEGP